MAKDKEKEKQKDKIKDFRNFGSEMEKLYPSERQLSNRTEHHTLSRRYFNLDNKDDIEDLLNRAYTNSLDAAEVSETLFNLDANYSKIISYFANMYHIRYVLFPVRLTGQEEVSPEDYMNIYEEMISIIDGANLEAAVPEIMQEVFIRGSSYLYGVTSTSSETITLLTLPDEYCRTVYKTNQGTNIIEFDFTYFDQFMGDDLEKVFEIYPEEFESLYREYQNGTHDDEWIELDKRFATSFFKNSAEMPPFLKAIEGIFEYEGFRANELKRSDNRLKSILTHQIPLFEDAPVFSVEEVAELQKRINKIVRQHKGLESVTTFGDTELLRLQEESSVENKQITQSYQTLFNSAGLNATVFTGDSDKALELNQSTDEAYVWRLLTEINQYINVLVNNLYSFSPYQAEIRFLPVTIAKEDQQIQRYRENASFGLGRLEAVVSTGIKQKHLKDRKTLEDHLGLDELLKPLESSHTQSGKDEDEQEDEQEEVVDDTNEPLEEDDTDEETGGDQDQD